MSAWLSDVAIRRPRRHARRMAMMVTAMGQQIHHIHVRAVEMRLSIAFSEPRGTCGTADRPRVATCSLPSKSCLCTSILPLAILVTIEHIQRLASRSGLLTDENGN